MTLASIPSPAQGVWELGPFPIRAYALMIILGIAVALWIAERRWVARGGRSGQMADLALWAVPFGIVGGRVYHVLTSWDAYFGPEGDPVRALQVWQGGLGIWGAVVFGGVGIWIGCRRAGIPTPPVADVVAPGLAVAQAIGRFGNWFNQELYGRPTTLPWGLEISPENRPEGLQEFATFHPTFLYEALWVLAAAGILLLVERRYRLGHGRLFALYIALYCLGRFWIEALRVDDAPEVLGLRWNMWMSVLVGCAAVAYVVIVGRRHPGQEDVAALTAAADGTGPEADPSTATSADRAPRPLRGAGAAGDASEDAAGPRAGPGA
jgi:prolipoprotein diacylglyceryl transferase